MLEARGLSKFYAGIPAVKDVNFRLERGGVLGLLGPNGSGKSTTVSMITTLIEPSVGQVLLDGASVSIGLLEYKARIGYVPEEAHLYSYLTGPEYLEFVGQLRGVRQRVLDQKIASFMHIFNLEDDRYAPMSAYSKGMRQKILISAALLHDPDIIVLDEPGSGLDVTSSLVLRSLVQQLAAAGKMVIYSSHVLESVEKVATDVLILHDSQVVAHDSVLRLRELMALPFARTGVQESGARRGRRRSGARSGWSDETLISERQQTSVLTRMFFGRIFESELMPSGAPQIQLAVWVIAFLAGPSTVAPILMSKKYVWLVNNPQALRGSMEADRTLALVLSMIATGLITLVIWEGVFPDRRDGRILGVLPVRLRTFVVARLAALMALFAMLVIAMTAFSSLAFGAVNATFGGTGGFIGRYAVALCRRRRARGIGVFRNRCAAMRSAEHRRRPGGAATRCPASDRAGGWRAPDAAPPSAPEHAAGSCLGAGDRPRHVRDDARALRRKLSPDDAPRARRDWREHCQAFRPPTVGAARGFDHCVLTSGTRRVRLRIAHRRTQPSPPDDSCRMGRTRQWRSLPRRCCRFLFVEGGMLSRPHGPRCWRCHWSSSR